MSSETIVPAIVQKYMELESSVKNRVRIALERLHQSLIRCNPADSTLEISMALEILLTNDSSGNKFKISLRAALLVSDNIKERMEASVPSCKSC